MLTSNPVNRDLKKHSRRVYSRQITEDVVQHIDELYWESGNRDVDDDAADALASTAEGEDVLYRHEDLTQDSCIARLPTRWDTSSDPPAATSDDRIDQDDYLSAMTRLQSLSAQRLTLQEKLNTYRTLLALMEPYRNPKTNVQPNLVWKEAPLAAELARTRTLAIRVAGRVGERFGDVEVPATAEDSDVEMEEDGKDKVGKILAAW